MTNVSNRELQDWLLDFAKTLENIGFGKGSVAMLREIARRIPAGFEFEKNDIDPKTGECHRTVGSEFPKL